jgi:type II secretory pathway pseudopilin PulG
MGSPLLSRGFRHSSRGDSGRSRAASLRAATLLELLVVLFIIGIMASMLFPALQAARGKADTTACQNNVRQLGYALMQFIDSKDQFPQPNRWPVDILRWMEERELADQIGPGPIPPGARIPRPKLFRCAAQQDLDSTVETIGICHYVLVVDRPVKFDRRGRVHWEIHDQPELSEKEKYPPWYVGPDISFAEQQVMLATKKGPHPSGIYYSNTGATLGGGG